MAGTADPAGPARTSGTSRRSAVWWVTAALTTLGMLAVLLLYSASGLVAPLWAVVALLGLWLALAVVAVRLHRRRGAWSLLVPLGALALWVAVLRVGEVALGWTA